MDKYIRSLYDDLEREVIADIARRVKKTGRYTETAELMAKAMREQGYNTAKIQREVMKSLRADRDYKRTIAQTTKEYKQMIKNLINDTVKKAALAGDKLVGAAGDMAWNDDLSVWKAHNIDLKKPNNLNQLYQAFKLQTVNQLRNITNTTGFKGTLLGTAGVLNMYQRSMDLALLKLSTGVFSYDQCVKDLIHQLAQSGLRSIDYANGRSYHLDTAARMVVRTASSQLAGKITEMNIQKTGVDLVYVDAHAGARPSHQVWQGQVYSYKGNSKKYNNFYSATNYGDVDGLKGVNCTHNFYPYWEGTPIPQYKEPGPVNVNGKEYTMYEATQEQRKMERGIRATKREIEGRKAVGYDTAELDKKLSLQRKEYKDFSKAVGIREKNNLTTLNGDTGIRKAHSMDGRKIQYDDSKSFKININGYSDEINAKLSQAAKEVAKSSGETGVEHGIFVDLSNGNFYNSSKGDEDSVPFVTEGLPKGKFAFVHSHTRATPISLADLELMIIDDSTDVMVATRIDGVITYAEKKETGENIVDVYSAISSKYSDKLSRYDEEDDSPKTKLEIQEIYRPDILKIFTKGEIIIRE